MADGNMRIWWKWLRRPAKCRWCEKTILAGEGTVQGSFRTSKGWFIKSFWHPDCYWYSGWDYLGRTPYIPHEAGPGRPKLDLTVEERKKRKSLIVQFSTLRSRKMNALTAGALWRMEPLNEEGLAIMRKIEPLGGVPRSWWS